MFHECYLKVYITVLAVEIKSGSEFVTSCGV